MGAAPPNNVGPSSAVRPDFFAGVPQPLQALELVAAFLGVDVRTVLRPKDNTVGTTAIRIDAYAGQRSGIAISNTGATQVVISTSPTATYPVGLAIPAGQLLTLNWFEDFQLMNVPLYAVSTGAGTTVHVWENVFAGG